MHIHSLLFTSGLLFSVAASLAGRVWLVDNNTANNFGADFNNLQEALDTAVDGDVIQLIGSDTPYRGTDDPAQLVINKKLRIVGPGYNLKSNYPDWPGQQQKPATFSHVMQIHASDVVVEGLSAGFEVKPQAKNVTIRRCKTIFYGSITAPNTDSLKIIQCILGGVNFNGAKNLVLSNNIIHSQSIILEDNSSAVIIGNTFDRSDLGSRNALVSSNLFIDCTISVNQNSTWEYNVSNKDNIPASGNKIDLKGPLSYLSGSPDINAEATFFLKSDSPAKGAGYNGDAGAFGGSDPYVLSGLPVAPFLKSMEMQGQVTRETGVKVKITAQARP